MEDMKKDRTEMNKIDIYVARYIQHNGAKN